AYMAKSELPPDPLTDRERQVLQLVAEGNTTKQIASLLGVSVKTAESHRTRMTQKLGTHETTSLVRYAIRRGFIRACRRRLLRDGPAMTGPNGATRVVLADDHHIFRQALKTLMTREGIEVVGEASDGDEAVELSRAHQPNVTILDFGMPRMN